MNNKQTITIGIAGASASGKSLLANTIVQELGNDQVVVISEDAYYKDQSHLPMEERNKVNYDHPETFDHDLLSQHLAKLQQGETINMPEYDFQQHIRKETTIQVNKHRVTVLEGILLFVDPKLRDMMDIKIFMDTPLDICLIRRLKRDMLERGRTAESILQQYQTTVRPMYMQFIEPSKRHADVIIPRGGENRIAINMLKAKITHLLNY